MEGRQTTCKAAARDQRFSKKLEKKAPFLWGPGSAKRCGQIRTHSLVSWITNKMHKLCSNIIKKPRKIDFLVPTNSKMENRHFAQTLCQWSTGTCEFDIVWIGQL